MDEDVSRFDAQPGGYLTNSKRKPWVHKCKADLPKPDNSQDPSEHTQDVALPQEMALAQSVAPKKPATGRMVIPGCLKKIRNNPSVESRRSGVP